MTEIQTHTWVCHSLINRSFFRGSHNGSQCFHFQSNWWWGHTPFIVVVLASGWSAHQGCTPHHLHGTCGMCFLLAMVLRLTRSTQLVDHGAVWSCWWYCGSQEQELPGKTAQLPAVPSVVCGQFWRENPQIPTCKSNTWTSELSVISYSFRWIRQRRPLWWQDIFLFIMPLFLLLRAMLVYKKVYVWGTPFHKSYTYVPSQHPPPKYQESTPSFINSCPVHV